MNDFFQERYLELPAWQQIRAVLAQCVESEVSFDEAATRLLMALENGLNWDTLCANCGVLMDKNYEQYVEIERLKEELAYELNKNKSQFVDGVCTRCDRSQESHYGYCYLDM